MANKNFLHPEMARDYSMSAIFLASPPALRRLLKNCAIPMTW